MTWMQQVAIWWVDFLAITTVLLVAVLAAGLMVRQPIQRMAMAWSAMIAIAVLSVCCAAPGWPRLAIFAPLRLAHKSAAEHSAAAGLESTPKTARQYMARQKGSPLSHDATAGHGNRQQLPLAGKGLQPIDSAERSGAFDYSSLVMGSLVVGSLLTLAWLVFGHLRAWRLCRAASVAPEFAQEELRRLVGPQCRQPRLLVDNRFSTAGAIGLWQPTILLPAHTVRPTELSPETPLRSSNDALRALLAHEWAHIQRGDLWLLALGRLLLVVLFAHPLYWLLRRRILADQELLADAAAADYCGRHRYAETLVAWARHQPRSGSSLKWALNIWERPGLLSKRIAMLLNERIRLRTTCSRGWRLASGGTMLGLVIGLSLFTLNPARLVIADTAKTDDALPAGAAEQTPAAATKAAKVESATQLVTISGTCFDVRRRPIANARVRLFRVDHTNSSRSTLHGRVKVTPIGVQNDDSIKGSLVGSLSNAGDPAVQRMLQDVQTDAKGQFRFASLPADERWRSQASELWAVAQAKGRGTEIGCPVVSERVGGKPMVDPLTLTLQEAASLRGRITNADGQPVAGATVSCCDINWLAIPVPGILCAMTDADGRYEINDRWSLDIDDIPPMTMPFGTVKTASFVMSVEHPDYAPGLIEYTKVPATIDHKLERPVKISGRVTLDESGQPAVKARVHWTHENGLSDVAIADEKGNYSIPRLLPGKYTIETDRDDLLVASQDIVLAAGDHRLDLRLKSGGIIKGRVVEDATGKAPKFDPSTGGQLQAVLAGRTPSRWSNSWIKDDGSFTTIAEPGRNVIAFPNAQWQLVDTEHWTKKGFDVAKGQTVTIELRVAPRPGGWASLFAEGQAAEAKAKGAPAPTPPPVEKHKVRFGDQDYDDLATRYLNWQDELLPKKPMHKSAMLMQLDRVAEVGRTTVDGEERVTSIDIGLVANPVDILTEQHVWLEYSVLAHIDSFPYLEQLSMLGIPGGNNWLEPLRGNKTLQAVYLNWSKNLTRAGINLLATLPNLKSLSVMGFKLDDGALEEVNRLPALEVIMFGGVITDAGIGHLRGNSKLKQLSVIALDDSQLTDESLRHIGAIPNLESVQFMLPDESRFTDDGLKHLAGLSKLKDLSISGRQITDAGLVHLYGTKSLRSLSVDGTSVTLKGLGELKKHLPDLETRTVINGQPVQAR